MLNSFEAKYFDGKSSLPQQIKVAFQNDILGLQLQISRDEKINWSLTDLRFERFGNLVEIRNQNYADAILKVENAAFAEEFYSAMKRERRVDIHTRLLGLGLLKISGIALGLLGLIVGAYFYILPPIAEKSAALLPESFDDKIGNVFIENYLEKVEVDTARSMQLEEFASQLKLKNRKSLRFTVVKSEEINAFALPNGHIVVFSGILDNMESADELAALLGHEVSHVNGRHSTKMLCRNLAGYMLVSLLFSDVNG
ncbi:MAG: M48 family metallopeptidase, partial [Crocinitomicaceae bacterium]